MKTYSFDTRKGVFTEWEVTINYTPIDDNRQYKVYNYKYIRRFWEAPTSNDKLDIRATNRLRSFSKKEIEYTNVNTFRFGKYCGKSIDQVFDLRYTCWYFEHIEDEHKQYVRDFLYNHRCDIRTNFEGKEYAVIPEVVQKQAKKAAERKEKEEVVISKANKGERVYLYIKSNPNSNGEIVINDVVYRFPKVVERYYRGCSYYMPVKNGQAKRIKNKTILADLFPIGDKIFISNFTICK